MTKYCYVETEIGKLLLTGSDATLHSLNFPTSKKATVVQLDWIEDQSAFADVIEQLEAYFTGKLRQFDLNIAFTVGTEFQKAVWREVLEIPYGKNISYQDIAIAIGRPKAVRAVGSAVGKNPIPVIVACHRVIASGGGLGGYSGGLDIKRHLLRLEKADVKL